MVSVTSLVSYLYCRRRLHAVQALGAEEPLNAAMVLGRIRHESLDRANREEEGIVRGIPPGAGFESVKGLFEEAYRKSLEKTISCSSSQLESVGSSQESALSELRQMADSEAGERARAVFGFAEKSCLCGKELWERLVPKVRTELRLRSGLLRLVGVVDRVNVYEDFLVPYELKSGAAPREGVWKAHAIQLAAHAMLLKDCLGANVSSGVVKYLSAGQSRRVSVNPFLEEEVSMLIEAVESLLSSPKSPEERCRFSSCFACRPAASD